MAMTRIDFYVLNESGDRARRHTACRIAEKAYHQDHSIYIHTDSRTEAHTFDDLLWTYRDRSFLPHTLVGPETDIGEPGSSRIIIGYESAPAQYHDVLINFAADVPDFFSRFERVAEVINGDEIHRRQGRVRFRFYKDRGYELSSHKL